MARMPGRKESHMQLNLGMTLGLVVAIIGAAILVAAIRRW
jgi:fucose permease